MLAQAAAIQLVHEMRRTSHQASAHLHQCAEFLLLRNRGLGPLAVTVLAISLTGGHRYRLRRRAIIEIVANRAKAITLHPDIAAARMRCGLPPPAAPR
jgi:hypothetical protein